MAQIRKHLGPVMQTMGLEAACFDEGRRYVVDFHTDRSFSPIALEFTHRTGTDEHRPSWSEVRILHGDYRKKKLGDTGWVHMRKWRQRTLPIEGEVDGKVNVEEMFAAIARKIRANKLLTFKREPMKMSSNDLADIFWAIDGQIPDLSVTRVDDEELPGEEGMQYEALTFIDHEGRRIHLCLRPGDGHGPIYADGEEIARIHTDELRRVAKYAVTLSSGIDVANFPFRG
ncbi:hypothetical protein ELH66_08115 [Rhizobium ruizarguesonis]|uniref:hypothetical protein n=1 Tax=Rhizobium ruizarguesonis TaxID=2081791 RepID=UPI001030EF1A|nr:hypothetical protein [Rhizobium ruizarguesonis]TBA20964.1 hypothetical protein ELH66_08115 [Rhizobium ruizarguesonis]